jgi:hypothetical protein
MIFFSNHIFLFDVFYLSLLMKKVIIGGKSYILEYLKSIKLCFLFFTILLAIMNALLAPRDVIKGKNNEPK